MNSNGLELYVEVGGRNIPEYGHKMRTFCEGRLGTKYALKFRNNRAEQVLVVPTIDNLGVIDGNPYHECTPGYVVQGYSSLTIKGWRTSHDEVREFEFKGRGQSVAGKTVGGEDCGVIGAKVYSEQAPPPVYPPYVIHTHVWPQVIVPGWTWYCANNSTGQYSLNLDNSMNPGGVGAVAATPQNAVYCCSTANSASQVEPEKVKKGLTCSAPDFNLGTGYGGAVQDRVVDVSFQKGQILATFELFYSDRSGLEKDGIVVDKAPAIASYPSAFSRFCKLPV